MPSSPSLPFIVASVIVPYLLGLFLSPKFISEDCFSLRLLSSRKSNVNTVETRAAAPECKNKLSELLPPTLLSDLALSLHRNGEADACGTMMAEPSAFEGALGGFDRCPNSFDKFEFDNWLTRVVSHISSCGPTDIPDPLVEGFLGFCDRGIDRTPILPDYDRMKRIPQTGTLPCHFHTREGVRVTNMKQLQGLLDIAKVAPSCEVGQANSSSSCSSLQMPSLHLYAVPAGRVFLFAPKFVGEIFDLSHVTGDDGAPISLKALSLSPRVFDILNFWSQAESDSVKERALKEKSESHRIKRSTTGASGKSVFSKRTSESGFDTHGKVAVAVKKRCFKTLGFDEYIEGMGDGLQILRYNLTTAYTAHMDWIDDPSGKLPHNYDSAGTGGNRFATILLYMSDLEEGDGGETVFTEAYPIDKSEKERVPLQQAIQNLRESGDASSILETGSWEEEMVAKCRSRLAITPKRGKAILFYSQLPSGAPDPQSLHGGCPVLRGEKYAANLWVWNTIRDGFPGAPRNPRSDSARSPTPQYNKKIAVFTNTGRNPEHDHAELFFGDDMFWAKLGKGDPSVSVNTYEGHVWTVKVNGHVNKKFVVKDDNSLNFEI